ncbi:MAG: NTP/NDP exchange transporter [Parachlamydiales bacterium]|nr:NTP/NDP exchange transporter [Parachlamydiales bacterium]
MSTHSDFGRMRSIFWPIHAYELKKVVPLLLMFFCICFNYTILRDTRDTLIVTAPGSGAEAIPFIKVWLVFPAALIFMLIYSKLSNVLSKQALFYTTLAPFLLFYVIFAFFLYPSRDALHPTAFADHLETVFPAGLKGLVAILRNWTFALFYVVAELWGAVMLSLAFWGFANDISSVPEAKRFYPLFGLGANFALLVSGPTMIYVARLRDQMPTHADPWGLSLKWLMSMVFVSGLLIMLFYYLTTRTVYSDSRLRTTDVGASKKPPKPQMSMKESFAFLLRSPYIGLVALLVIGFNMCINLVEVTWKSQLKLQFPHANDYSAFMGMFSTCTGIVTIFMMLFLGSNVLRRFGWRAGALVTPVVLISTGVCFFSFVLFKDSLTGLVAFLGTSPLMLAVIFGAAQNMLSKSSKYSFFDPTKEMAFIPLDQESKVKGKAAIDVVGSRLGKSGGSLVQQGLLVAFGSMFAIIPYVGIILFAVIGVWIFAVFALSKRFAALQAEPVKEALAQEPIAQKAS